MDTAIDEELESISDSGLAEKRLGEMSFTVGCFSLDALAAAPVFIAVSAARVSYSCSWLPYAGGRGVLFDLMCKRSDAPFGRHGPSHHRQVAASPPRARLQGSEPGHAPLANWAEPKRPLEKGVALLFEN